MNDLASFGDFDGLSRSNSQLFQTFLELGLHISTWLAGPAGPAGDSLDLCTPGIGPLGFLPSSAAKQQDVSVPL